MMPAKASCFPWALSAVHRGELPALEEGTLVQALVVPVPVPVSVLMLVLVLMLMAV